MKLDLSNKTVAITGGAGGLGRAIAAQLVAKGARVAILDLDGQRAEEAAALIGPKEVAAGWQVDVRDLQSLEAAMHSVEEHFKRIDVVIAGAGIGNLVAALEDTDPRAFERIVDINLTGTWRAFRAAAPYVKRQRGHLLAIASMASFLHAPLHGSYTSSKAGVWALCNSLRLELAQSGVTVGSIHPVFFSSPMIDEVFNDEIARQVWNGFEGVFAVRDVEEVAAAVVRGLERRARNIVVPKSMAVTALMPGLIGRIIDKVGYPATNIRSAIQASAARFVKSAAGKGKG